MEEIDDNNKQLINNLYLSIFSCFPFAIHSCHCDALNCNNIPGKIFRY